jgi:GAF domain-containing protein
MTRFGRWLVARAHQATVRAAGIEGGPSDTAERMAASLYEFTGDVRVLERLIGSCAAVADTYGRLLDSRKNPELVDSLLDAEAHTLRVLELFEIQAQEGPCLDCYRTGQAVVNQDLDAGNGRWARFAAEALGAGFHSAHAIPMRLRGSVIGALNLFRAGVGEMGPADVEIAQAFADVATIAILQHRAALEAQVLNHQLTHALNSRVVLEQAKGMVAERLNLDMEQSFATLRNHARNHNLRLSDVAQSVIDSSLTASELDAAPTKP